MSLKAGFAFAGKKFILSAFVIVSFVIYSLTQRGTYSNNSNIIAPNQPAANSSSTGSQTAVQQTVGSGNAPAPAQTPVAATPTPTPTPKPTPAPAPAPAPAPVIIPTGQYKDGIYTGISADAYYGKIQVRITISGGKITDVVFLDYPQDRGTSREINGQAMPFLKQEAIAAQSANVDIVSGATDSSLAFRQSLASALAQAKS